MHKLEVVSKQINGGAVLYLRGYLNESGGELLEQQVRGVLRSAPLSLALDFSATAMVNSIGISFLLEVIEAAEQKGIRLEFVKVPGEISELFDLLGISSKVPVRP